MGAPDTLHKIPITAINDLLTGAGVLFVGINDFEILMDSATESDILGVTTGGISFSAKPKITDFVSDQNVRYNREWLRNDGYECTLSGTFASVNIDKLPYLAPTANEGGKNTFSLAWVGEQFDGRHICIVMDNCYSTKGFQLKTGENAHGKYAFEFRVYYPTTNEDSMVPLVNFYVVDNTRIGFLVINKDCETTICDNAGTDPLWCKISATCPYNCDKTDCDNCEHADTCTNHQPFDSRIDPWLWTGMIK